MSSQWRKFIYEEPQTSVDVYWLAIHVAGCQQQPVAPPVAGNARQEVISRVQLVNPILEREFKSKSKGFLPAPRAQS